MNLAALTYPAHDPPVAWRAAGFSPLNIIACPSVDPGKMALGHVPGWLPVLDGEPGHGQGSRVASLEAALREATEAVEWAVAYLPPADYDERRMRGGNRFPLVPPILSVEKATDVYERCRILVPER